jgi:hypothetical protein
MNIRRTGSLNAVSPEPTSRVGQRLLLAAVVLILGACQTSGGHLELASLANPQVKLAADFKQGCYAYEDINHATVVLLIGSPEKPEQVLTIRPIWTPSAGHTPIAATASNAQFTYVIFPPGSPAAGSAAATSHGEVGLYTGYGFLYPTDDLGDVTFSADIWDSTMELADKSPGFTDPLGKATLRGNFSVARDDLRARELVRKVSLALTQCLNYPRVVEGPGRQRPATAD